MAGLPPDGRILIQQNDGIVSIFDQHSQEIYLSFDPSDVAQVPIMMGIIWHDERLTEEQRCFAIFWSGYFRAHASMGSNLCDS